MISVVINTLNEEANIGECIESVRVLANEIVVCDMHSQDRTTEIARHLGARVEFVTADYCDFGRLRYFAVLQAQYDWVLVIDADERMTSQLAQKLLEIADESKYDVVFLNNLYWYFGGWVKHGGFFHHNWPRFFRREIYLSLYKDVDEEVHNDLSAIKEVENHTILPRQYYLEHYAYPSIEKYMVKTLGAYAKVKAEQQFKYGKRFSLFQMIFTPIRIFLQKYVFQQGFRDGVRGLILAILFAGYRFAIWANIWLMEELEKQR